MALLKKHTQKKQDTNKNEEITPTPTPYPTSMDEYAFEGRIGKGAFASVFIAKCLTKNEKVAIKVIELELTQSQGDGDENGEKEEKKNNKNNNNNNENDISWDEIQKEASIMARMNHKNIVSCYTSFSVTSELWLVMPLLIGSCLDIMGTIKQYNNGFAADSEHIIATILRDVLCGVQYIHNDGRVHRDIKAANILLSDKGICQISDFGVSGAIIEGGLRKNGRHTFTGSIFWMSPEVLQRENKHSYKADIWSLGITALELAFGKPPHSKQRPVKVMLTILQSPPPTLQSYANGNGSNSFSKKFKDFLNKCLQKDPNKRCSANVLLNHSFIKQSKDNQYLFDKIVSKYNKISLQKNNELTNNILPYSVSQKLQKLKKKKIKKKLNYNINSIDTDTMKNSFTIDDSTHIESNGFDFNSEINSISHSDALHLTNIHQQNTEKLGRFDVTVQNKQNKQNISNHNDIITTTTKGRFRVKKIT